MNRSVSILFATLSMWCVAACQWTEETSDRYLDLPTGGLLTVDLPIGSVSIVGSDVHDVSIHARVRGSDAVISQFTISAEQDPSGARVTGHLGVMHHQWFGARIPRVQLNLEVPRNHPVTVRTSAGSIELLNLHASVQATAVGGSITLRNVVGPVNARARGGAIRVSGGAGDLDLQTVGGSIRLQDIDGRLSAETTGGGIYATVLGDHDIMARTYGGSIKLGVPVTTRASLEAHTVGGSVHADVPLRGIEHMETADVRATVNSSGHSIYLKTMGGSIQLEPYPVTAAAIFTHSPGG